MVPSKWPRRFLEILWEIVSHTYSGLGATSIDAWNFAKKEKFKIPK
jgi:hypothetical protein